MFVVSSQANLRAKDMDIASQTVISALEEFKAANNPNDIMDTDFIFNSLVSRGLSDFFLIEEKIAGADFDFSEGVTIHKYFDEDWNVINPNDIEHYFDEDWNIPTADSEDFTTDSPAVESGVKFRLTVTVPVAEEWEITEGGYNMRILADVYQLNRDAVPRLIAEYETRKYYSLGGELNGLFKTVE
jgi:hypothetical protein